MGKCVFCDIDSEKTIYRNDAFHAKFDAFPVSPGHALVVPNRHVVSIAEFTEEEWALLKPAILGTIKAIEETNFSDFYGSFIHTADEKTAKFGSSMLKHAAINKKPDGYNIGVNIGEAAGQTIEHINLHIIPRYLGEEATGGLRQVVPDYADYLD